MNEEFPRPMSRQAARRRRGRNIALLVVLLALAVLFYAISLVRLHQSVG